MSFLMEIYNLETLFLDSFSVIRFVFWFTIGFCLERHGYDTFGLF